MKLRIPVYLRGTSAASNKPVFFRRPANPITFSNQANNRAYSSSSATKTKEVPLLQKRRTIVVTGAVAAITIAGTLIGATLKSKQQVEDRETIRSRAEAAPINQIALLESTRSQLVAQKIHLENKIEELKERQRKKSASDVQRERMMAATAATATAGSVDRVER